MRDLESRFLSKIDFPANAGACWTWAGARTRGGYGLVHPGGGRGVSKTTAHRVAYRLYVGPIPAGYQVDHLCRNRACVNPTHLQAVTPQHNVLLSNHPTSILSRANTCKEGHTLDADNTYVCPRGKRYCHLCWRTSPVSKVKSHA